MTKKELIAKLKPIIRAAYSDLGISPSEEVEDDTLLAYDELTKFPELKDVIVDLLTVDFSKFMESIDWVAPRPTTFRINLLNGQNFILVYHDRGWEARVEGKNYYLLNLDEEQRAAKAIARILEYGAKVEEEEDFSQFSSSEESNDNIKEPVNQDLQGDFGDDGFGGDSGGGE